MIPFSKPYIPPKTTDYLNESLQSHRFAGDCQFSQKCHLWFEQNFTSAKALLMTSGTHALELACLLADIKVGDEVIMPSFTFSSTANAFVLRGAKIIFVDIRPDTMNIDENLIEAAIGPATRAIVPMHYAGVACEMDAILDLARSRSLLVIEDAAQAFNGQYKGRQLGTLGDFGAFSFHETKNISCGEGGALMIADAKYSQRAEILREKGTNRSEFFRGRTDKYTWMDIGSSYLPSDLNAAVLLAQLEMVGQIQKVRTDIWKLYFERLKGLADAEKISLPVVPDHCEHNGHIFYIRVNDREERGRLIEFLSKNDIKATFHYIPLHQSLAGKKFGRLEGEDRHTTKESERLLRLPLYYGMTEEEVITVCDRIEEFYR